METEDDFDWIDQHFKAICKRAAARAIPLPEQRRFEPRNARSDSGMKRFKNILIVCDEQGIHDELISRAIWLAKANECRITVTDVIEAAPGELARLYSALPSARAHDIELEVIEWHRARLAQLAAPIRSEGITTSENVLQGIPFVECEAVSPCTRAVSFRPRVEATPSTQLSGTTGLPDRDTA